MISKTEVWTGVRRYCYSKALDRAPGTGRVYHRLDVLAHPNMLQQLFIAQRLRHIVLFMSDVHKACPICLYDLKCGLVRKDIEISI